MNNTNDNKTFELRAITSEMFGDHANRFLQHLLDQDYTADTIKHYRQCIDALGGAMHESGVLLSELDEALAIELVRRARRGGRAAPTRSPSFDASSGSCATIAPASRCRRPRPRRSPAPH